METKDIANLDFDRKKRRGFGEVIYCEGKESQALIHILKAFQERGEAVLGTRCKKELYQSLLADLPELDYDEVAGCISLGWEKTGEGIGEIAICSGGTSDMKLAEETAYCCHFFGAKVTRYYDIGVAGLQRLLGKIDEIKKANVIIVIAGMEGALPTVITGLVDKPVIAVPSSVGYGANFQGLSALLSMLNSCAEGMSVVNIDNGFGAAYQAAQINQLIEGGRK